MQVSELAGIRRIFRCCIMMGIVYTAYLFVSFLCLLPQVSTRTGICPVFSSPTLSSQQSFGAMMKQWAMMKPCECPKANCMAQWRDLSSDLPHPSPLIYSMDTTLAIPSISHQHYQCNLLCSCSWQCAYRRSEFRSGVCIKYRYGQIKQQYGPITAWGVEATN